MLKVAAVIPDKYSETQDRGFPDDPWKYFRELYDTYKKNKMVVDVESDRDDHKSLKIEMKKVAERTLQKADAVVATSVQGRLDLLKNVRFKYVGTDESSVLSIMDILCAWRESENLIMVGDEVQLTTVARSTVRTNPMYSLAT